MKISEFVSVGENIHCTRVYKVDGKYVKSDADGKYAIHYTVGDETRLLPIPEKFIQMADWESGKVKHTAVAIYQGFNGNDEEKQAGIDFIQAMAKKEEAAGATYLDVNVDEYSTDIEERIALMEWTVKIAQEAVSIPVSVDSSNIDILKAGLKACDTSRGRPMINSVSLERTEAIDIAVEYNAVVIASVAGKNELPTTLDGRMKNLEELMTILTEKGLKLSDIHVDPLVFPIAVDGNNGNGFIEAVSAIREKYGKDIHIVAGLSNISFGMPKRKLINQIFTYLCVEAGADGGIVDPAQINIEALNAIDPETESFKITHDLLTGKDDFGMNYITAIRAGDVS